ncbi:MAG: hypothetical protein QM756_44685 [Polyangiaceae bacterium]
MPKKGRTKKKDTRIWTLLRLFDKVEYAEQFRAGKLRLHKLKFFREYLDSNGELRGDPWEGTCAVIQPSQFSEMKIGDKTIRGDQLLEPIRIAAEFQLSWSLQCFYALTNAGFEAGNFDSLEQLRELFLIHQRCYGLGASLAYLVRPQEFMRRFHKAIRAAGHKYARNLVTYYDANTFHGEFRLDEVPFRKRQEFSHQREYRFSVYSTDADPDPLLLDVGDLSDICKITTPDEFNRDLKISIEPKKRKQRAPKR